MAIDMHSHAPEGVIPKVLIEWLLVVRKNTGRGQGRFAHEDEILLRNVVGCAWCVVGKSGMQDRIRHDRKEKPVIHVLLYRILFISPLSSLSSSRSSEGQLFQMDLLSKCYALSIPRFSFAIKVIIFKPAVAMVASATSTSMTITGPSTFHQYPLRFSALSELQNDLVMNDRLSWPPCLQNRGVCRGLFSANRRRAFLGIFIHRKTGVFR